MRETTAAIPRFPLEWPAGWTRTPASRRQRATFGSKRSVDGRVTVSVANTRLEGQLDLLGATHPVLSTNLSLRLDGRPRSEQEPSDPGAAVYFVFKGRATVLAVDKWTRVADNITAIAWHIDAIRRQARYGVGTIEQALSGYTALPADTAADWRTVFGLQVGHVTVDEVKQAFRDLAKQRHPDVTHDDGAAMAHLNRAFDYACAELGGS